VYIARSANECTGGGGYIALGRTTKYLDEKDERVYCYMIPGDPCQSTVVSFDDKIKGFLDPKKRTCMLGTELVNDAHWYEVPLNTRGAWQFGRLYSTRMPHNMTDRESAQGGTEAHLFWENVQLKTVTAVVALVQAADYSGSHEDEPALANSPNLFRDYVSGGLTVIRFPMEDFTVPSGRGLWNLTQHIAILLMQGHNVVVHCWGGSGRTGLVVNSVAKLLGQDPQVLLEKIATSKGAYFDVQEQIDMFLEFKPKEVTSFMQGYISKAATNALQTSYKENQYLTESAQGPCELRSALGVARTRYDIPRCTPDAVSGKCPPGSWPRPHDPSFHPAVPFPGIASASSSFWENSQPDIPLKCYTQSREDNSCVNLPSQDPSSWS